MEKLNHFEQSVLIQWFEQQMSMEQRGKLMRELPVMYNKLCGREIVHVVRVEDGTEV